MKSALLWYSGNYELSLTEEDLKKYGHSYFTTHDHPVARWLHQTSQFFLWPFRKSAQFIIRAVQPRPGEDKDDQSITQTPLIRVFKMCLGLVFLAISAMIALVTFPFHLSALIVYKSRPAIGYIRPDIERVIPPPSLEKDKPLIVCSYNLALMLSTICIINDIRSPEERAIEIAEDILDNKDEYSPDILCFQEVYNQDAAQAMIERLKEKYPYILYNVAPTAIGIGSGLLIASKYPIKSAHFLCFKDSKGEDGLAPKGALSCSIETTEQPLYIYNTHLQAMHGREESAVRLKQMQQIEKKMVEDKKGNPKIEQVLIGDLNVSRITPWDAPNETITQPDHTVLEYITKHYDEPYYDDHDVTGKRLGDTQPYFQKEDLQRVGDYSEPRGTWLLGPYATPNNFISSVALSRFEKKQKEENFQLFSKDAFKKLNDWGTRKWKDKRPVTQTLYDHFLIPIGSSITAKVEVRNTKLNREQQSGSSDHLPLYGRVFKKNVPKVELAHRVERDSLKSVS